MGRQSAYRFDNGKSLNVNAQTADYTLTPNDNGWIVTVTNAVGKTITVPALLPVGFNVIVYQMGAGRVTFSASGTTINNVSGHSKSLSQYSRVQLECVAPDVFVLSGSTGV